jgi:hypothetical protein
MKPDWPAERVHSVTGEVEVIPVTQLVTNLFAHMAFHFLAENPKVTDASAVGYN